MSFLNSNTIPYPCQYALVFDDNNSIPYASSMSVLRENLQKEMAKRGWSAYDLENESGVPQPTIQRFLSGKHGEPRGVTVRKLASGLGVSEGELRGLVNNAALKAVPSADHKDQADAVHKQSKTTDNDPRFDFLILMCDLCDDLIDEGLFPDDRESRRSLYIQADDLVDRYENNITIEKLEVLLRSMNNVKRTKMLK